MSNAHHPLRLPPLTEDWGDKFSEIKKLAPSAKEDALRDVKALVRRQAHEAKEPWNLMRASNHACYTTEPEDPTSTSMDPFFFEPAIRSPFEHGVEALGGEETEEETAAINELFRRKSFSFRHYSYGVGPDKTDRPPWTQLLSSQGLSEKSLKGSGNTDEVDWIMFGTEAFVFCTIAVGDIPFYDIGKRQWYTELKLDSITDAWFSKDSVEEFERAEGSGKDRCYSVKTADDARRALVRANTHHEKPECSVPMIRSNGEGLLRLLARLLYDLKVPPDAEEEEILKGVEYYFEESMEVKVARNCIPLENHPNSNPDDPSPWVKNPRL
ncbi:hypothetical protein AB8O64_35655 (plasmid) [Streptomyces sp. QH1-20]|uniref:hypothetical protein n=1 Tax=Streptomyces sp. QH1-20 TaxID=3240934 RepID=UPI0035133B8A